MEHAGWLVARQNWKLRTLDWVLQSRNLSTSITSLPVQLYLDFKCLWMTIILFIGPIEWLSEELVGKNGVFRLLRLRCQKFSYYYFVLKEKQNFMPFYSNFLYLILFVTMLCGIFNWRPSFVNVTEPQTFNTANIKARFEQYFHPSFVTAAFPKMNFQYSMSPVVC